MGGYLLLIFPQRMLSDVCPAYQRHQRKNIDRYRSKSLKKDHDAVVNLQSPYISVTSTSFTSKLLPDDKHAIGISQVPAYGVGPERTLATVHT
jgi:hypothetical protein